MNRMDLNKTYSNGAGVLAYVCNPAGRRVFLAFEASLGYTGISMSILI